MNIIKILIIIPFIIFYKVSFGNSSSYYEPVIVESNPTMVSTRPLINNIGSILYSYSDGEGCSLFKLNIKGKEKLINYADCENTTNYYALNDNNQIVFTNYIDKNYDIYLYNNEKIVVIGNDSDSEQGPQINNNGQAAWWSNPHPQGDMEYEVYIYDDGIVKRLNPSGFSYVSNVRINNYGHVVWHARPEGSIRPEVLLYSNGVVKNITNTNMVAEWNPEINDHGQIVWHANGGIHLYHNGILQNIAELFGCGSGWGQKINNAGDVAWIGNNCDKPFDFKVLLYQNGTVKDIGGTIPDDYEVRDLSLNNNGQVVWGQRKRGESKVFLYSDGVTQTIGSQEAFNDNPQINDLGQIVFWSWMPDDTFHVMLANPTSLDYPDYYIPLPSSPPSPVPISTSSNSGLTMLKLLLNKTDKSPQP